MNAIHSRDRLQEILLSEMRFVAVVAVVAVVVVVVVPVVVVVVAITAVVVFIKSLWVKLYLLQSLNQGLPWHSLFTVLTDFDQMATLQSGTTASV